MNPDNVVALSAALLAIAIGLLHRYRYLLRHRSVHRRSDEQGAGPARYPFSARF